MSYVGPGGQRPDPSRYYSPQMPGAQPQQQPSFTPSFAPNTTAYMSPTVGGAPNAYQSPPPSNPAQFVRQPSFVPETKPVAKGPAVDFSFDPRGGSAPSAVPQHVMQSTASRSSSGGFPAPPQHTPTFAPGPAYPPQMVGGPTPQQYASAPTLARQPSVVQNPTYPAPARVGSSASMGMPSASPSALPLPQTPAPSGPISPHHPQASGAPTGYAPSPAPTFAPPTGSPMAAVAAPSFTPVSPPPANIAAPLSLPPHASAASPTQMPLPSPSAPSFAPVPSADHQRQIAELTDRAKQAEEKAVLLKAQLDESHKQFQELVSKQSKLELSSQTFGEQQKKYEEDLKALGDKLRGAEEKAAANERRAAEAAAIATAATERATAIEKQAGSGEERAKAAEEKLRAAEERARKFEEQLMVLSTAQTQGNSTLAQQMALRDALEAALKEANDRLSKADGIWQTQNQRIAALEAELQQWRHQGPAKELELQAALTREKTLKEALEQARKAAADSSSLTSTRTQEALLQLEQRNAELKAAHQREAELKRLLEQRGPDSGSSSKVMELQAQLDAKVAELATAARREQAFRDALEKAKKNLTDADTARAALEEDLAKAEENVHFFKEMAKNNEALAAAAEAKLERAIATQAGQPFAPQETPSPTSVLDNIRARLAALNTGASASSDSTADALAELDGL